MARSVCENIRNVKNSLENAEKSFRENNGVRGELDLMLAEAGIKRLREKRGWEAVWTRQRLAFCAAAIVVLAGYGGWLYAWNSEAQQQQATAPGQEIIVTVPQNEAVREVAAPALANRSLQETQLIETPAAAFEQAAGEQRSTQLPTADMRQLVREARKTLRDAN